MTRPPSAIGMAQVILGVVTVWAVWRLGQLGSAAGRCDRGRGPRRRRSDLDPSVGTGDDRNLGRLSGLADAVGLTRARDSATFRGRGRRRRARAGRVVPADVRRLAGRGGDRLSISRPSALVRSRGRSRWWRPRPPCWLRGAFAINAYSVGRPSPRRMAATRYVGQQRELLRISARRCLGKHVGRRANSRLVVELAAHDRHAAGTGNRRSGPRSLAYAFAWENIRDAPGMFAYSCVVRLVRCGACCRIKRSRPRPARGAGCAGRWPSGTPSSCRWRRAVHGFWASVCSLHPWVWGMLLVLSFSLVHAFYWTDMRMCAPLMCVVALAAAHGWRASTAASCRKASPSVAVLRHTLQAANLP